MIKIVKRKMIKIVKKNDISIVKRNLNLTKLEVYFRYRTKQGIKLTNYSDNLFH